MSLTIKQAIQQVRDTLSPQFDSWLLDSHLMLCHCLSCERSTLLTHPERVLSAGQINKFQQLLHKRAQGEPLAYLIGYQEFWSHRLHVNEHTLIPRPETELLVEQALGLIGDKSGLTIADLGTGTGAIAIAIAKEHPGCEIVATDLSPQALAIAKQNIQTHQCDNIALLQSRWFEQLHGLQFDLVLSNPPYIAVTSHAVEPNVARYEPTSALFAGENGLEDIRQIIATSPNHLKSGGWLLLEHGFDQADGVQSLFAEHKFQSIQTVRDLSKHPRVTLAQWGPALK